MRGIDSGMSGYLHSYEAYRVPKGTTVKDAAGEETVLSKDEDVLVLTEKASRQLVKDRKEHNCMLQLKAETAAQRTQQEAMEKNTQDMAKIMAVYRTMAKGDIVPASDEKKLQEYDPDLYQMAKTAQTMALHAKRKKHKSQWDEEEEKAHREKMDKLRAASDEANLAVAEGSREFSAAQKKRIVEIASDGVDFSSLEVMNLGSGVTGTNIDLSM